MEYASEVILMNERMTVGQADNLTVSPWRGSFPQGAQPWPLVNPRERHWAGTRGEQSLEDATEALVSAFLAANLKFKRMPLKDFMDDFERRILRTCLTLTRGHQRSAATILGLKYTALFEKMRKHCINGRQLKLTHRLRLEPPPAEE
jgi:DNA-binding NtrC family response regulator